ncbi:MAG: hypothetical protein MH137_01215 [Flavobacteriales bacterium]|nr:hypothetical protein [Flavobacteriales bacterium]
MKLRIEKVFYLTAILFVCGVITAKAQVVPPPTLPPPPTTPPPSAGAPLDPLSWIVLGAGGAAAAGKYYNNRKNKADKS